jgi:hypothetical protein
METIVLVVAGLLISFIAMFGGKIANFMWLTLLVVPIFSFVISMENIFGIIFSLVAIIILLALFVFGKNFPKEQLKELGKKFKFEYLDSNEIDNQKITRWLYSSKYLGYLQKDNLYFYFDGDGKSYSHALKIEKNRTKFKDFRLSSMSMYNSLPDIFALKQATTNVKDFNKLYSITGEDREKVSEFFSLNRFLTNLILEINKNRQYVEIKTVNDNLWIKIISRSKKEENITEYFETLSKVEKEFNF